MFAALLELPDSVAPPDAFAIGPARGRRRRADSPEAWRVGSSTASASRSTRATGSPRRRRSSSTTAVDRRPRWGSIGPPLPGVDVRLVDADGGDVAVGDPGEIWVRGPNVFAGYWDDPEATARVLHDGWLRTGDVAVADDDGFLSLVDRMKDLIIVSGFNVYPAEVEEVLLDAPRRRGRRGRRRSEARGPARRSPRSWCRSPARSVTLASVRDHVARRLGALQGADVPSRCIDELPRNQAGKLLRRELDARLA